MLASDDVDIVYVGTPDEMHKQHSLLAIEAGKHVLCEKILAKSVADAEETMKEATQRLREEFEEKLKLLADRRERHWWS